MEPANAGTHAFKHHGTGGHGVEQETEHHHQGDAHQKAPPVPPDELCRLFTLFGGGFGVVVGFLLLVESLCLRVVELFCSRRARPPALSF